jgi:ABC-type sugar transport system, periplasmic component
MKEQRVTLKHIAEQLNISVGTVDRAIHGRGRINEETRTAIMQKINELGYKPNQLASVLGKNKETRISFVTPSHNQFWQDLIEGARTACEELADYGLKLDFCSQNSDFESVIQVKAMSEIIERKPDGIIVAPLHPYLLCAPINEAVENGIPVISVNRDSKDSKRLCYVGENPYNTGKIVGIMYGKYLGDGGKVAVLTGSRDFSQFHIRKDGFLNTLKTKYPKAEIIGYYDYADDMEIAYEISKKLLTDVEDLKGIFANTGEGATAISRAIKELDKIGKVFVVCYDINKEILELLDNNVLNATVTQSPSSQGYYAVKLMHKVLLGGLVPDREFYYTRADIIIDSEQYNLYASGLYNRDII